VEKNEFFLHELLISNKMNNEFFLSNSGQTEAKTTPDVVQNSEFKSNTNGIFDQFYAMEQLKMIQGIVNSEQKFSKENVTMMLMLCGFSNIKEIFAFLKKMMQRLYELLDIKKIKNLSIDCYESIKSFIRNIFKLMWYFVSLKFLRNAYRDRYYKVTKELVETKELEENKITIKLASTQKIYEALIKYVLENKIKHKIEAEFVIDNKENALILTEVWNEVEFLYEGVTISINSKLSVEFVLKNERKNFLNMSAISSATKMTNKIKSAEDIFAMIPFDNIRDALTKSFAENFPSLDNFACRDRYSVLWKKNGLYDDRMKVSTANTGYLLCYLSQELARGMGITSDVEDSTDDKEINYKHHVIFNKLYHIFHFLIGMKYDGFCLNNVYAMKQLLFKYDSTINCIFGVDISIILRNAQTDTFIPTWGDADANIYIKFKELENRAPFVTWIMNQIVPELETKSKQKYIDIKISSKSDSDSDTKIDLMETWLKFSHDIQTLSINEFEAKIPMEFKYLCIKHETILKEVSNPKYEEYMKKFGGKNSNKDKSEDKDEDKDEDDDEDDDDEAKLKGKNKSSDKKAKAKAKGKSSRFNRGKFNNGYDSDFGYYNSYYSKPPVEFITIEEKEAKLSVEVINSIYKDPTTLYLAEKEKKRLQSYLYQFKYCKDKLKDLGLPYKLGIMLYGLPGTGKSSTIQAIVTYFQKPAYYINLNGITKNSELKMMFDHVTKECLNGGIIVMEDIDAMTKIVHSRQTATRELSVGDIMGEKDSDLTLEYLLNLLQGSLTVDGTIFVATTNHIDVLDPAFIRDGRFDVKIELKKADYFQLQEMYVKFIERKIPDNLLIRIPEYEFTCATIIAQLQQFILSKDIDDEIILEPFIQC
jgi:hypothetical protein